MAVLRFYREAYKFARSKPEPLRGNLYTYLRKEMDANRSIPRMKFNTVRPNIYADRAQATAGTQSPFNVQAMQHRQHHKALS